MTVSSTASEISYATDGVTVNFPIPFAFETSADIVATLTDSSGNIQPFTSFSTTGGGGSTGTLTTNAVQASGYTLTIFDDPIRSQTTDYISNDAFPADSHERALDKGVRISKRLYQMVRRALRTADGDPITDLTLGSVDNRKGKYLFFNAVTGAIEYAVNIVTTTLSRSIIGALLNPQTAAESAAGVLPVNYFYPEGNVKRYGADPTGIADSTTAINGAIAVAAHMPGISGGFVYLPAGTYKTTAALNISTDRINFYGDGIYATSIQYTPTVNGTCINVAAGASRINQGSLRNFAIYTANTTTTKVGIALQSVGTYVIDNVLISGSGFGNWTGGGASTCLKINGRDTTNISNITLVGDKPIVIGPDPNEPSISIDHFNFHNVYLLGGTTAPLITILTGVVLTQVSFTGFQAWVGGGPGLQWIDTTSTLVSNGLVIHNPRFEQTADAAQYMVDIQMNVALQGFQIRGGQGGDRRGFKFRKVESVLIDSFSYTTNLEAFNADSTVRRIAGINCFWQAGSTKTVTGQRLDLASPLDPNTGCLPPTFIYNQTANADSTFNIGLTTSFTVTRNSFTEVLGGGSITATGSYTKIGKRVEFAIKVVCAGGATIASVANTSYFSGLPAGTFDGVCQVSRIDNTTSLGNGWIQASGANVLPPVWGAAANATYLISGSYEVA